MTNENENQNEEEGNSTQKQPDQDFIRLDHFLQACGVPTGGQAKKLVQNGNVLVNGEVETRRRRKLREGDEVDLAGELFIVTPAE